MILKIKFRLHGFSANSDTIWDWVWEWGGAITVFEFSEFREYLQFGLFLFCYSDEKKKLA